MNLSDRDRKIILVLLIIAVIALPYVLYIKDTRVDTDGIRANNETLRARLSQLQEMNENREFYEAETERLHADRDAIIANYPADVRPEYYTMFLLNTEYSSATIDPSTGESYLEYPMMIDSVTFGNNSVYQISAEGAEEVLYGVSNMSNISYRTYYAGIKYLLQYLLDYQDPMTYSAVSIGRQDPERKGEEAVMIGTITLNQYAISGAGRTMDELEIWPDLDDLNRRGNEEDGIFGPRFDEEVRVDGVATGGGADESGEDAYAGGEESMADQGND